jgi:hypothetical protein
MAKTYVRKTKDEYTLQQYTGAQYGWEDIDCSDSKKEMQESKKIYQTEAPQYRYRIIKTRIKL